MEIFLANPRGFCAGVKRAIAIVNQALEKYGAPVYVLHDIVHNTHVVNDLASKGAVFVQSLEDIPRGEVTIFSAHGVAKAVEKRAEFLELNVIDATCPLVSKVHHRVAKLNNQGFDVLIIGHKKHPEVEGTCGRAQGKVQVVSSVKDLEKLEVREPSQVGYVTQTTLSMDDTAELIKQIKTRFPEINSPKQTDICYATQNRQTAVRKLAGDMDVFLVVGSKSSSNSNRLREVAESRGTNAYLIDNVSEIDPRWLEGANSVGVTAGASAPEILVEEVIEWLKTYGVTAIHEIEGTAEYIEFRLPDLSDIECLKNV